jgi:hypothetical protein
VEAWFSAGRLVAGDGRPLPLRQAAERRFGIYAVLPKRLLCDEPPDRARACDGVRVRHQNAELLPLVGQWIQETGHA